MAVPYYYRLSGFKQHKFIKSLELRNLQWVSWANVRILAGLVPSEALVFSGHIAFSFFFLTLSSE